MMRSIVFMFLFLLIKSAYACSPVPPYTDEKIEILNIISNQDFSDDFPAGANLNSLFNVEYNDQWIYKRDVNSSNRSAYRFDEYIELNLARANFYNSD